MAAKKAKKVPIEYEIHHDVAIATFTSKKKAQDYVREQMADGRDVSIFSFRELSAKRFVR